MQGNGFEASVPGEWEVNVGPRALRAFPDREAVERVEVVTFRLARRYRPALWPRAVVELDGVARRLTRELGPDAALSRGRTGVIAGRRARVYDIAYARDGDRRVERVAFVLSGRREFQLLCRWSASEPEAGEEACDLLFRSFRLA